MVLWDATGALAPIVRQNIAIFWIITPDDTLRPRYLLSRYVLSRYSGFSRRLADLKLQNMLSPSPRRSQRDFARILMRTLLARPNLPVGAREAASR